MDMKKKSEPPILRAIEELYEKTRKKVTPLYPYDQETGKIDLPEDVIADLKSVLLAGKKVEAVKRVIELTGAGLRMSKDYVDDLQSPSGSTMATTYAEPVSKLLKLGRPEHPWQDYLELGITRADIPELMRLVQDNELRWLQPPDDLPDDEDLPDWYGQIHAWRALGQLKAEEAIPALLGILHQIDDDEDDWLSSDAHTVFGMIGSAAIEPLADYLADEFNPMYARSVAGSALAEIGKLQPESREHCILGIAAVLEKYETNDEALNGFLIGDLVDLKAVEQIDLIKRAFEAGAVDEFINGDVEDVQVEMGLLEKRLTPARPWQISRFAPDAEDFTVAPKKSHHEEKKQKNKRKQEKKSRKKNRKRK